MTLSLPPQLTGFIELIPSLPIHSSVLIPLVAGLFLAALILRAQRLPAQAGPKGQGLTTRQARAGRRFVYRSRGLPGAERENKGKTMSRRHTHDDAAADTPAAAAPSAPGFRIHWGRSILAATALLALLGGIGTAVAAPFLAGLSWAVPAICALVLVAALASLRVSAVVRRRTQRRQRVEQAMREAMGPPPQQSPEAVAQTDAASADVRAGAAEQRRTGPFDALSGDRTGRGGPDSLVSIDADGLPESPERLFGAHSSAQKSAQQQLESLRPSAAPAEPWEVRSVPAAHYMVAAKAERPEPEPLEEPAPAPSSEVKLKQSAASPEKPEVRPAEEESINLDQVLRRRRA
ncbi:hypothetical protein [Nesterenkonia sphaerica]|uniref:Uncharacterized protein n=1 Tax=Nesterenkonia sphaerica TaxID=1804988 RepID=A0A5R9AG59_9MICC|nr:hypothetical protein [Nesterenkonia sphaerica]TLP76806.1 hypothetical protein FEF27_06000 [Nesterenkonia sphaerica]